MVDVYIREDMKWRIDDRTLVISALIVEVIQKDYYYMLGDPNPKEFFRRHKDRYYSVKCDTCRGELKYMDGVVVCENCERVIEEPMKCVIVDLY